MPSEKANCISRRGLLDQNSSWREPCLLLRLMLFLGNRDQVIIIGIPLPFIDN